MPKNIFELLKCVKTTIIELYFRHDFRVLALPLNFIIVAIYHFISIVN